MLYLFVLFCVYFVLCLGREMNDNFEVDLEDCELTWKSTWKSQWIFYFRMRREERPAVKKWQHLKNSRRKRARHSTRAGLPPFFPIAIHLPPFIFQSAVVHWSDGARLMRKRRPSKCGACSGDLRGSSATVAPNIQQITTNRLMRPNNAITQKYRNDLRSKKWSTLLINGSIQGLMGRSSRISIATF